MPHDALLSFGFFYVMPMKLIPEAFPVHAAPNGVGLLWGQIIKLLNSMNTTAIEAVCCAEIA